LIAAGIFLRWNTQHFGRDRTHHPARSQGLSDPYRRPNASPPNDDGRPSWTDRKSPNENFYHRHHNSEPGGIHPFTITVPTPASTDHASV
jgi:hypothetical protein